MIATLFLFVFYFFIVFSGFRFTATTASLLGREYASMVKGVCSLVVIMVHIPAHQGNKIQDAISSFAFVCVSLFFIYSSYGVNFNLVNKKDYLSCFWSVRIPAFLVHGLVINVINALDELKLPNRFFCPSLLRAPSRLLLLYT